MLTDLVAGKKRKPLPPHWYYIYTEECAACGYSRETRERRLTPRPENPEGRYDYTQFLCYSCMM
jgi:hypothetical protein